MLLHTWTHRDKCIYCTINSYCIRVVRVVTCTHRDKVCMYCSIINRSYCIRVVHAVTCTHRGKVCMYCTIINRSCCIRVMCAVTHTHTRNFSLSLFKRVLSESNHIHDWELQTQCGVSSEQQVLKVIHHRDISCSLWSHSQCRH